MIELAGQARLTSLFKSVAPQVPEEPPAGDILVQMGVDVGFSTELGDEEQLDARTSAAAPHAARHRNWRSFAAGAGVVAAVAAVGTGVAAATGMLSPSAIQQNLNHVLTPAISIVGSTEPASVPRRRCPGQRPWPRRDGATGRVRQRRQRRPGRRVL